MDIIEAAGLAKQTSQQQTPQQRQAAEAQAWRAAQDAKQRARDAYLTARLANNGN